MKRAKSNRQIVEEFVMRRPVSEPLDEYWKGVVDKHLEALISSLESGGVSSEAQIMAARLLRDLTGRKRGRPKQLKSPTKNAAFSEAVDWAAARYEAQGHEHPVDAALRDAQNLERDESGKRPKMETLEDWYRKGVVDRRRSDVSFAREIDAERRRLESLGNPNGLEQALAASAGGNIENAHFDRARYERGQRKLAKLRRDKHGENPATIWMRMRRRGGDEGRA